jgi:hypothetical protein
MSNIIKYIRKFFDNMNKYNDTLETNSRNIKVLEFLIFTEKTRIDELTRRIEELESEILR